MNHFDIGHIYSAGVKANLGYSKCTTDVVLCFSRRHVQAEVKRCEMYGDLFVSLALTFRVLDLPWIEYCPGSPAIHNNRPLSMAELVETYINLIIIYIMACMCSLYTSSIISPQFFAHSMAPAR